MQHKISVITVVYNDVKGIRQTLFTDMGRERNHRD